MVPAKLLRLGSLHAALDQRLHARELFDLVWQPKHATVRGSGLTDVKRPRVSGRSARSRSASSPSGAHKHRPAVFRREPAQ